MKLTVTIETAEGTMTFNYADPQPNRDADDILMNSRMYTDRRPAAKEVPSEMECAATELQRITSGIAGMTGKPTVTVAPGVIESAAKAAVESHVRAMAERSKAGKAAAALKRGGA